MDKKTMMTQLATVSEAALGKLAQSDLSKTALQGAITVKDRVERLMSKMTDLDERVIELEKPAKAVTAAKKAPASGAKRTTTSAAKKKTATTGTKPSASTKPAP